MITIKLGSDSGYESKPENKIFAIPLIVENAFVVCTFDEQNSAFEMGCKEKIIYRCTKDQLPEGILFFQPHKYTAIQKPNQYATVVGEFIDVGNIPLSIKKTSGIVDGVFTISMIYE